MLRIHNSNKPKSWKDWFNSRHCNILINDCRKKQLFNTFNHTINDKDCKQKMLDHEQTAFLFKQNLGVNRINVIHHLVREGGNVYDSNESFGAIQGIGEGTSCVITPDVPTLVALPFKTAEKVPKPDDIYGAKTVSDIENVNVNDSCEFLPRNVIPIPPFLLNRISSTIERTDGNGIAVLLAVIEEITDYDDTVVDNEEPQTEDARTSCIDIVYWLYLTMKGKIYSTPTLGCSNRIMRERLLKIENEELYTQLTLAQANQVTQSQSLDSIAAL